MTADTLGNKITQDMTFRSETDRCSLDREDLDHDGADTDRAEVSQEILNNIETNFNGEEAVCFSKDGRWYSTSNFFQGSNSFEMSGRGGVVTIKMKKVLSAIIVLCGQDLEIYH